MTEQERMNFEGMFRDLGALQNDMDQLLRHNGEWAGITEELEKFKRNLLGFRENMADMTHQAHKAIMGDAPASPSSPDAKDGKVLSKEEQRMIDEKLREVKQVEEILGGLIQEVINTGSMGPEDVMRNLNDMIDRMLSSLPDGNLWKERLKHLRTRIENGDEIGSLLERANKLKPSKKVAASAGKEGITVSKETLKALGIGGTLGAALLAAPGILEKASQTDTVAGWMQNLQQAFAAVSEGQEVEVEAETEEVEEEIEVEEDERVVVKI